MNNEVFDKVVDDCVANIKSILSTKGIEYGGDDDRLEQFKLACVEENCSPEKSLRGMAVKHRISVSKMINDIDANKDISYITPKHLDEKIGDEINYLILLKALILERIGAV